MKRSVLPLLLALLPLFSIAQDLRALDKKFGFRDVAFGTPLESFQDLVFVYENSAGTKFYKRPAERLHLESAPLSAIHYGFYEGKLSIISIETPGQPHSSTVRDVLTLQFGLPDQLDQHVENYDWRGRKVLMNYQIDANSGKGMLLLVNKAVIPKSDQGEQLANVKLAGLY